LAQVGHGASSVAGVPFSHAGANTNMVRIAVGSSSAGEAAD
jgi:hypothetical protein